MEKKSVAYLREKIHYLLARKRLISLIVACFVVFTALFAFTSKNEYKTQIKVLPELQSNQNGLAGGLLKQFGGIGLNLGDMMSAGLSTIPPELYDEVVNSTPFLLKINEKKIFFSSLQKKVSLKEYFELYNKESFIIEFFSSLKEALFKFYDYLRGASEGGSRLQKEGRSIVRLTEKEEIQLVNLENRIEVVLDTKTGILKITTKMPDPYASADLAQLVLEDLQENIIQYKNKKASDQLLFVKSQFDEAKEKFEVSQNALADFRDKNFYVSSARAKIEETRLQSDYDLYFGIYSGLAQQLEQSKIRLNENTPIFKMLEPARVPFEKYGPKRLRMLIFSMILGLFFSVGFLLIVPEIKKLITLYKV